MKAHSIVPAGIAISNTTADPFGTAPANGSCRIHYYGHGPSGGQPPPAQTTYVIPAGQTFSFTLSGGGAGVMAVPGFDGYIIADCGFPLAQGFYIVTDGARQKFGAGGNAIVLPNTR
jgi:hypothetical protein